MVKSGFVFLFVYPKFFQECPYFTAWSLWNKCSVTCRRGTRSHPRTCIKGNIGDFGCEGVRNETSVCSVNVSTTSVLRLSNCKFQQLYAGCLTKMVSIVQETDLSLESMIQKIPRDNLFLASLHKVIK